MSTVQKAYRLESELVERIERWAEAHGVTQAEAVRRLLAEALEGENDHGGDDAEVRRLTVLLEAKDEKLAAKDETIQVLRSQAKALLDQLAVKDEQIRDAHRLADHAQVLQLAEAQRGLPEASEPSAQKTGWRLRLARWIAGEE